MSGRTWMCAAGLAAAVFGAGCGRKIESFSAVQLYADSRRNIDRMATLYVTPKKVRVEQAGPSGEGTVIMIYRRDQKVFRALMTGSKTYLERPLDEGELDKTLQRFAPDVPCRDLGTETIQGFKCRKKEIATTLRFMGRDVNVISTVWQSKRLDVPLRTETREGAVTELRNIRPGRQAAELFEVPKGYTRSGKLSGVLRAGRNRAARPAGFEGSGRNP